MKLTMLFLTVGFLNVHATGLSQNISFSGESVPLESVFSSVKKQTGYLFLYDNSLLELSKPVSISVKDVSLDFFLDKVFSSQPSLQYKIEGKSVFISSKPPSLQSLSGMIDHVQDTLKDVKGRIVDEKGEPLATVNVIVKGTSKRISTNARGEFVVKNVDNDPTLVISFVGYETKEIKINHSQVNRREILNITLSPAVSKLDEVQIIAYGTTTKRLSTGNVSTVKAEDIAKAPVNNPLLALQGRVPGLMIEQSNGMAGATLSVRIQGQNSINNGNTPFYVIDGVPYMFKNPLNYGGGALAYDGTPGNPLSFINPGDIESIDVLKDADATAIYGSRAANGAILITTKKGKAGKLKLDLNVQQGKSEVPRRLNLMNTEQYLVMRREAIKNDELTIPATPNPGYYDLTLYDQHRYTDWQKELIGKTAGFTDFQGSISGGNSNVHGMLGVNYHKETDVFPGDFADQKGGAHISLSGNSENRKFQFQFTSSYLVDQNKLPGVDITNRAIIMGPNAPALYTADGSLNWEMYNGANTWSNPLAYLLKRSNNKTINLVSSANLLYEPIKGLQFKTSLGYARTQSDISIFTPQAYYDPYLPVNLRSADYETTNNNTWNIDPQLSYQYNSGYGKFDFLVGATFQQVRINDIVSSLSGFKDDSQLENRLFATNFNIDLSKSGYNYDALFGRLNYNYQDKYLLTVSARRDGSSRFGPENLMHNFYSAAGAWVFSQEKWFQEKLPLFTYGKIKLSYGTSGSDQIGDYKFMNLYNAVYRDISYGGGNGLQPAGHSNPYLQWEETHKLNAGIDVGILNDRVLISLNYYRNRSSNQLLDVSLPLITGFDNISQNFDAKVQNSGIELTVRATSIQSKNFRWTSDINFSINRNKLIEYRDLISSTDKYRLIIGEPITITKVFNFAGVNPQTGLYQFRKADGSLSSDLSYIDDKYAFVNTVPKYFGGWSNTLTYKRVELAFLLQFVRQTRNDPTKFGILGNPGVYSFVSGGVNQPLLVLNNWKQPGDQSDIQKFSTGFTANNAFGFARSSNEAYVNASYVRLKNVSLSWALPKALINKAHLQDMRLYARGQNLVTFTPFKGLDPESTSMGFVLPPLRTWTLGFQITL